MKTYVITYDLIKEINSNDYKTLAEAIKTTGLWCRPTESTWVVYSFLTSVQIYDIIRSKMDSNDKLFVCELAPGNWRGWVDQQSVASLNAWLG